MKRKRFRVLVSLIVLILSIVGFLLIKNVGPEEVTLTFINYSTTNNFMGVKTALLCFSNSAKDSIEVRGIGGAKKTNTTFGMIQGGFVMTDPPLTNNLLKPNEALTFECVVPTNSASPDLILIAYSYTNTSKFEKLVQKIRGFPWRRVLAVQIELPND